MVVGVLMHNLLQDVLKQGINSLNDINLMLDKIMSKHETLLMLHSCSVNFNDIKEELATFVPRIYAFVMNYVKPTKGRLGVNHARRLNVC